MTAAPAREHPSRRSIALTIVAALVGTALLVWQVRQVGLAEIASGFSAVGAGFAGVLVLSWFRFVLRALAWRALLPPGVRLGPVVAAAMAGDALGNLTPLSILVGEPTKVMYLGRAVPPSRAAAALTAENFFYSVSVAIYVVLGTAAMLVAFPVPGVVADAGIVALVLMAVVLAGAAWLAWQRPALASAVVSRLPSARLRGLVDHVRTFEQQSYGSSGGQAGRLATVVLAEATFHVFSFIETWGVLWLLTGASLPLEAFVLDTFSRIVNVVFKIVPLRLGVDEYASREVAEAIGLGGATGLTLALVRKGRVLVWAAVGVVLVVRRTRRRLTSPVAPRSPSTS
ncbi:MAG TPA: lysylphosphatidylglycerol synthase domain-containing protein [Vicinamibacterales bacterium]|nr:lysylphosphatidylglycerol synthase domain-containing protein [Vicinamibacterales bacterium]